MIKGHTRLAALCAGIVIAAAAASPAGAAAPVQPYQANDYKGFHDILPPGTNGLLNLAQLGAYELNGSRPPHNDDQLRMYGDLVYATPGLTQADIPKYFKDASFGVKDGEVASSVSPRDDVTIIRDKAFGVPHIYATTRAGALFGEGYAAAQDRLFFIDVLRHLGRSEVASFAGGAPGNRAFDHSEWQIAPYTEADLQRQFDQFSVLYGAEGRQIQDDATSYTQGVNAYIDEAKLNPTMMPGEYAAIGKPLGPDPWQVTDIIATASLVGGIFGKGGGGELDLVRSLQAMQKRFGARKGRKLWYQFAALDDKDAPTTVKHKRFPYQLAPKHPAKGGEVLPDPGTLKDEPLVVAKSGSGGEIRAHKGALKGLLAAPSSMSNALLVSARKSASGHPLAVFGPQTGYFNPQILMEQDVHAPTIDAQGAAFPGVNLYVELGRGRDYAWSATSANQDIIDTFALQLCNADGSKATLQSSAYRYKGACVPFEALERTNSWSPTLADSTPAGSETLRTYRSKLGLVTGRGLVKGRPYAFTKLRSTYMHEIDSALGFSAFNDPEKMRNAKDFQRAASKIGYTFNWLYADDKQIAYFNSGNNPLRAKGTTGLLPMAASEQWQGFDPATNLARYTPPSQHPQVIDQDYITSWNNRQAQGYVNQGHSSVFRSQMLDHQIDTRLAGGRKLTLPGLIDAMEEAGTTDLRGYKALPLALKVIGRPADPDLAKAVATLKTWITHGTQRRDRNRDGVYEDHDAIRIMDAWWPKLLHAEFEPRMGKAVFDTIPEALDNAPNNGGDHLGSAYEAGWYGYVYKDLRDVLGLKVKEPYAAKFCGNGSLAACRTALRASLKAALAVPEDSTYNGDGVCSKAGKPHDQYCYDTVSFRALGVASQPLIHWINRPTFQQAVEIQGHRPRG